MLKALLFPLLLIIGLSRQEGDIIDKLTCNDNFWYVFCMQMKLELVAVPVSDVDRAKDFYTEKIGFHADHDHQVRDDLRFVQLTPPGSACSFPAGSQSMSKC